MNNYYIKKKERTGALKNYTLFEAICKISNGSAFFCKKKREKTIFDKYGPGIPLYFIFMKTVISFMVVASLLSLPMIYLNIKSKPALTMQGSGNLSIYSADQKKSFSNYAEMTTLSAIIEKTVKSFVFPLSSSPKTLYTKCETGVISTKLGHSMFGLVATNRYSQQIENIYEVDCVDYYAFVHSVEHCAGQRECQFEYRPYWIKSECLANEGFLFENRKGFVKFQCASKGELTCRCRSV
jgi:hypothetical protein